MLKKFKTLMFALVTSLLMKPRSAMAAVFTRAEKTIPSGLVSYSAFLQAIKDHTIERVRISPDGRFAEFLNLEGIRGSVNLFNDPNLFNLLQKHGVDLSVMPIDHTAPIIMGLLQALAFPILLIGGLMLM